MSRTLRGFALVALLTAPLLAACGGEDDAAGNGAAPDERAVPVTFVEVEAERVEVVERALGSVEAVSTPRIAAEVSARVQHLHVDSGDSVGEGDLLAELDSEDFEIERDRADAEIGRLEARIENQQRTVEREERLHEQGHTPEATLDEARTELTALQQELASARSDLRTAERNIERTEVLAPFDGIVDERHVSESDFIQTGEPLFTLAATERLRVLIPFPETTAQQIEPGQEVRLSTPLATGNSLTGEIAHLRPLVGEDSRAVRAIVEIENPGNWRPGASVNAELLVEERENIVLPNQAVVRRPDGEVVYLLEDDRAVEQPVEVGRRTRAWLEILEGVSAGDPVIVDGASFLTDGAAVRAEPLEDAPDPQED